MMVALILKTNNRLHFVIEMIHKNELIPLIQEINELTVNVLYRDNNNNIYAFPTELCRFVGYEDPKSKASRVCSDNEEILKVFQGVAKSATPSGEQEVTVLTNEGIHFFIMELNKPKAKILKLGYSYAIERFRKQEYPIVKQVNSEELSQMIKTIAISTQTLLDTRSEDRKLITKVNNKATKAFKIASEVQDKFIQSAKNESKRKRVWELKHELAKELSKYISLRSSHWLVMTRLRKKYQFYKFEKMSPHFYDDAIEWLEYKIKHTKQLNNIPPPFRNNNDLEELKKEELPQKQTYLDEIL